MKTIPIIAQLRSTSGYDTDAPYVYMELDTELLDRIEKAVSLYSRHQNDPSLGLSKLTIRGPSMTALVNLPELTENSRKHWTKTKASCWLHRFRRQNWMSWKAVSGSVVKTSTSLMPGACTPSLATSTRGTCMKPISGPY